MADSVVVQVSPLSTFDGDGSTVTAGTATGYRRTLSGVTAGNALIASIAVHRDATSTGELVSSVTDDKGNTWSLAGKVIGNRDAARFAVYEYVAHNVAAGTTNVNLSFVAGGNKVSWILREVSNLPTSASVDLYSSSAYAGAAGSMTVNVPAPSQAGTFVSASLVSRFVYIINGGAPWTGAAGGTPPAGFTLDAGMLDNAAAGCVCQFSRLRDSAQAARNVTWTLPSSGEQALGLVVVYKETVGSKRVRVVTDADMNGKTGITLYAWAADPYSTTAYKWTGLTAEATGGVLLANLADALPNAPNWSVGQSVMVTGYNSTEGFAPVDAVVEVA